MHIKLWTIVILLTIQLHAGQSPIHGYERNITSDKEVVYTHTKSKHHFEIKKLIDSHNYYHGGTKNTYDDAFIARILQKQPVAKMFPAKGKRKISLVFNTHSNMLRYLKEKGLSLFLKKHVSVSLVVLDKSKLTLPLQLSVYPFFVMGSRYTQGVINDVLLEQLIEEQSSYAHTGSSPVALETLKSTLKKKFSHAMKTFNIQYNPHIELFEVRSQKETEPHSYISSDGRYIMPIK